MKPVVTHRGAGSTPSDSETERDALIAEAMELDRQGKVDEAALGRLDARIQAHFDRLNREYERSIAEIETRFAARKPRVLAKQLRIPVLLVLLFVAVGSVLELTVGQTFIFAWGESYRAAMPWVFPGFLVLFAVVWFAIDRTDGPMRVRSPTPWVRWLFVFPFFAGLCAAMVVIAPLGWAALSGWMLGDASGGLPGKVLRIAPLSTSPRACRQYVELEVNGSSGRVCMQGWPSGQEPNAGDAVIVRGSVSVFGVMVEEVRRK